MRAMYDTFAIADKVDDLSNLQQCTIEIFELKDDSVAVITHDVWPIATATATAHRNPRLRRTLL